jgi:hypothetical protein
VSYVRLCKGVKDAGILVREEAISSNITDHNLDWYRSSFSYPESAYEYFIKNDNSIGGYTGEVFTDTLYWDLDCKEDFTKAVEAAKVIYDILEKKGLNSGIAVYFSGNKGIHITLKTKQKFSQKETQLICNGIVRDAGAGFDVADTKVYNINRIFRIENTKHQGSGLFKIKIGEELYSHTEEQIRALARQPRKENPYEVTAVEADFLKKEYNVGEVIKMKIASSPEKEFDVLPCPPGEKKCMHLLQCGCFGPGERQHGLMALTTYYRCVKGYSREHTKMLLDTALEFRAERFPKANPYEEKDTISVLDSVYSDNWKGGYISCRTDPFLQGLCGGNCEVNSEELTGSITAGDLHNDYLKERDHSLDRYPQFGLAWLDSKIKLAPKDFTVLNGACGSGKTSIVVELLTNLNKQKIWHKFYSMDMSDIAVFLKIAVRVTGRTRDELERAFSKTYRDMNIVKEVREALVTLFPYTLFNFKTTHTVLDMGKYVQMDERQLNIKIEVVIVDYVGCIANKFDSAYANSSYTAKEMKDIPKSTNSHWVVLSQISREKGDHTSPLKSTRMSKDSGAWEDNATAVLNVWRPFGNNHTRDNYMHLFIAKNRRGQPGVEEVFWWEGKTGTIRALEDHEAHRYDQLCAEQGLDSVKTDHNTRALDHKDTNGIPPTPRFEKTKEDIVDSRFSKKTSMWGKSE